MTNVFRLTLRTEASLLRPTGDAMYHRIIQNISIELKINNILFRIELIAKLFEIENSLDQNSWLYYLITVTAW